MVILDVAIVNVALPSIKSDLGFSATGLQWVITAYAILFGGTLLLGGRLADLLGRRRMFVAGLALFSLSSLLCGFAWSSGSLVAFRALQGLGGALLAPAALSLLMTTFAEGRERNRALGIYGAASGSGAAAGVLLGGVLTSYFGWSWIFFINVPVGAAAIALTPFLLRDSRADLPHRHFDLAGASTVTSGLMLLVYGLTRATSDGWSSPVTLGLLGGAAALIAAFIWIESRSHAPLLPLRIFRLRSLSAANATMALVGAVTFSEFFVLTLYVQDVLHYSAVQSGVAFVAFALSVVVMSNVAQVLVGRVGIRTTLMTGLTLATISLGLLTRVPVDGHYFSDLFVAVRARRRGARPLLRSRHDREPGGCRTRRRRRRLWAREHESPDRRRRRPRRDQHDRRERGLSLRERSRRLGDERVRDGRRLPDRVLRPGRPARRVARDRRCLPPAGARARVEEVDVPELREAA